MYGYVASCVFFASGNGKRGHSECHKSVWVPKFIFSKTFGEVSLRVRLRICGIHLIQCIVMGAILFPTIPIHTKHP